MRKKHTVLIIVIVVFLLQLSTRIGYCNSWWGKNSLLMRSFWLCSCGAEFEQSLYPDHVEVVFSACDNVRITPVARADQSLILVYGDDNFLESDPYLWQPMTGKKTSISLPKESYEILSDELLLLHGQHNVVPPQVINFISGESAPITIFDASTLPDIYLSDGSVNPNVISLLFDNSSQIFAEIKYGRNTIIVLGFNWIEQSEYNFILSEVYLPEEKEGWLKDVVDANGRSYTKLYPQHIAERVLWKAPNEHFFADKSGIHALPENELILSMAEANHMTPCPDSNCLYGYAPVGFQPCCWYSDNSAVLYEFKSGGGHPIWQIPLPSVYFGAPIRYLSPSMPILKVTVPEE